MSTLIETYEQAIEFLIGRINYERTHPETLSSNDFKLDRMRSFLAALNDIHLCMPAIHVAGTKGKGSVCSMLASILNSSECPAGLFTSPHLTRFEERMQVAGRMPTGEELVALVNRVQPVLDLLDRSPTRMHPTYFELATALAWLYFADKRAKVAVLETGLGGRLDSTNLCQPWVTIITNVSRDHTQILGTTVREIATEKAGIIKPGIPVISGVDHPDAIEVITATSQKQQAPLWLLNREIFWSYEDTARRMIRVTTPVRTWENIPVPLRGEHQANNTALVVAAIDRLPAGEILVTPETLRKGLSQTHWPARIEVVGTEPTVVLDAAHNWASAKALASTLERDFTARRKILIFACSRDKDFRGLLRQLAPHFDSLIVTRYLENPRAVNPEELQRIVELMFDRPAHVAPDPVTAWKLARRFAHPSDLVVITGSLFLVGELRDHLLDEVKDQETMASSTPPIAVPPETRSIH